VVSNRLNFYLFDYCDFYDFISVNHGNQRKWEIYVGCENILGYKQKNPIIDAAHPFGENFDSSLIWGPIHGQMVYLGIRFAIEKK